MFHVKHCFELKFASAVICAKILKLHTLVIRLRDNTNYSFILNCRSYQSSRNCYVHK